MIPYINKAMVIGKNAHEGQIYGDDRDYFDYHVMGVAELAKEHFGYATVEYLCALLHDVVEDSEYTLADLISEGIPLYAVSVVDLLTKPVTSTQNKTEAYKHYLMNIATDGVATNVKLLDMAFNCTHARNKEEHKKYSDGIEALLEYRRQFNMQQG